MLLSELGFRGSIPLLQNGARFTGFVAQSGSALMNEVSNCEAIRDFLFITATLWRWLAVLFLG